MAAGVEYRERLNTQNMDNKQENTLRIQEHLLKTSHKY